MKWFYESNGQPLGPIPETELRRLRSEGSLTEDSRVWRMGMEDWATIGSLEELSPQPNATPFHAEDLSAPKAARARHSSEVRPLPWSSGMPDKKPPASTPNNGQEETSVAGVSARPEWENMQQSGPLTALLVSLRQILFEPSETFRNLASRDGWGMALGFFVFLQLIGNTLMLFTMRLIPKSASPFAGLVHQAFPTEEGNALLVVSVATSILVLPLAVLIKAAVIHVEMKLLARSQFPFSATFRALCYTGGAEGALWIIPFTAVSITSALNDPLARDLAFGLSISVTAIWTICVTFKTLARVHQVSVTRTVMAIVLPPFLAGILVILLASAIAYFTSTT